MVSSYHLENYQKNNSCSIYQRNLQVLATKMYKISKDLSLPLMRDIFKLRSE